jgi:hypothetical protein
VKKLLSIKEAAAELGITEKAYRQQAFRGRVPLRRLGHKCVVPAGELQTFVEKLPGISAMEALAKIESLA